MTSFVFLQHFWNFDKTFYKQWREGDKVLQLSWFANGTIIGTKQIKLYVWTTHNACLQHLKNLKEKIKNTTLSIVEG